MRGSFPTIALLLSVTCTYGDSPTDASVKDDLGKARLAFEQSKDEAKKSLLASFGKAEEAVQTNKTLSGEQKLVQIQQLRDEKKNFQDDGKLPTSNRMKSGLDEYQFAISTATKKIEKSLDQAIEGYIKLNDLDTAKQILAEKKALTEAKPTVVKKPDPPIKKPDPPVKKVEPGTPAGLLGKWDVRIVGTGYRTEWTFEADGTVKSSEGDIKTGKWKVDKDKKRVRIVWDGSELWETLNLPLDPKSAHGETSYQGREVIAVKSKD